MRSVGVRELKARTTQVLRDVRERKESLAITYRGRIIARLVPADPPNASTEQDRIWAEFDELAAEIGARWPQGTSANEVVNEQRREL